MNNKNTNTNAVPRRGISFFSLLGLVFITLKLCGVIDWSWWWVLLPIYGIPAGFLLAAVCVLVLAAGVLAVEFIASARRKAGK